MVQNAKENEPSVVRGYPERFDLREWDVVTPVKQQDPWGTCGSAAICPDCGYVLADYTGDNESLKRQREEIMDIMMALFDQETLMKRDFWTRYEYI